MSCRTTRGGTLTTRLARVYSGLSDSSVQSLFHALKRDGENLPLPTDLDFEVWKARQHALIANSDLSDRDKEKSERDLMLASDENIDAATFYAWYNIERRARQQAVIRALKGNVADLSPPGSQIHDYEWGADGRPARVWYASYGSNMERDRFLTYVKGGTAEGSTSWHRGCRDRAQPLGDIPIRFRGRMHFAYASRRWEQGGVAFMDNDGVSHALGRAYNVTMEQFDDIVAQENGGGVGHLTTPADEAIINGHARASHGVYGEMVHIGDYNGAPVFTFTGDFTAQESIEESYADKPGLLSTNEPSPNYIRMVGNGLHSTFGMSIHEQADYIRGCPGMETMGRRRLLKILRTPPDKPKPSKFTSRPAARSGGKSSSTSSSDPTWMADWNRSGGWDDAAATQAADQYARAVTNGQTSVFDERYDDDTLWRSLTSQTDTTEPTSKPSKPAAKETYVVRPYCAYCKRHGHKMNDCPALPSNTRTPPAKKPTPKPTRRPRSAVTSTVRESPIQPTPTTPKPATPEPSEGMRPRSATLRERVHPKRKPASKKPTPQPATQPEAKPAAKPRAKKPPSATKKPPS